MTEAAMKRVRLAVEDFVTDEKTRGMGLHLSTYDIPRSADAEFEPQAGVLKIKFKYIDDEPSETQVLDEHISIECGKNSKKILQILIQVSKGNIGEVRVYVSKALEQVDRELVNRISHTKRFNQLQNYEGIKTVLEKNRMTVVSSTSATAAY